MLQENKPQINSIIVDGNVNPEKGKQFVNDLATLLNNYGLDGTSICNSSTIQISIIEKPVQANTNSLVQNKINNIIK